MGEDAGESSGIGRRKLVVYLVACFLIGAMGVVAGAHLANSVHVSGGVPIGAPDGLVVTVEGTTQMDLSDPTTLSGTVNVVTEEGNATVFSTGVANATIHADDIEGTWTNVTAIDADQNAIQIDPADKDQVTVGRNTTAIDFRSSYGLDDGTVDFVYSGTGGLARVSLNGVQTSTTIAAVDADTGTILDVASSDNTGFVTFNDLNSGDHDVTIQAFSNSAPTLSNASPTGGQAGEPTQLSVDVSDGNFPGDSVDVTIDFEGTQIHSETITSNGTVTTSIPSSGTTGGQHSWSVEATDSYGPATTSDSYTYSVPSTLTFREEEPGHDIIENGSTDPIRVEAVFFEDVEDDPTIINRTTTNGTLDLDGLPVSSEFSVSVQAPGYHNRTVRLDSIFEQSSIFLISQDQDTVENRFVVSDRSGNFPADQTTILVQAPVNQTIYNGSGGIQWLTVSGDDLGADEAFVDDLIDEKRYRILVENEAGDQRNLGAYTAETTGTIQLTIGRVEIVPEQPNGTAVEASWNNETGSPSVRVAYNDTARDTSAIHVNIYERNNASNVLVDNQTFTGSYGQFAHTEPVPAGEEDTTWVVEVVGERSGENVDYTTIVGPGSPVLTDLPPWVVTILFVGMIWGVAGMFSQLNGHVGGLVVAGMGAMFYFVGLVPGYLGGGVVALSLLTAGILFVREGRGGAL